MVCERYTVIKNIRSTVRDSILLNNSGSNRPTPLTPFLFTLLNETPYVDGPLSQS